MVATMHVHFDFGGSDNAPGTQQDVDALGPPNLRFKTNDNATIDTVDPVPIVTATTKYSYWKQIYLKCTAGTFTQIDNVKFYTDNTPFGTGIDTYCGDQLCVKNSGASTGYDVATGTVGDTGDRMDSGANKHTDLTTRTQIFTYTSAAPRTITISETGSKIDAINETTDYLVVQLETADTASPGDLANETWTYRYDEI